MNKIKITIWGREFDLDVIYQTFSNKGVIENQETVLSKAPYSDFEKAEDGVKEYIQKYYYDDLGNEQIDNIFKYVMPKSIFVLRNPEERIFAIICRFKFDPEHGIAVVFENEEFREAGPTDIIL